MTTATQEPQVWLSSPAGPTCPIDEYGARAYYKKAIASVTKRITNVGKRLAAESLAKRPALIENPRFRATRYTKPREILEMLGQECFWIPPYPAHRDDRALRDHWVATILNRPGWTGDWWKH
jgi:hypothetical protein